MPEITPRCAGCGRTPDQIPEYVAFAAMDECSPSEFVQREEGTYNATNGHFLCTEDYIRAGSPSGPNGWIAP